MGGRVFGGSAPLDVVGAHAGDEGFRKLKAAFVDVCDYDGFGARGGAAEQCDQADGSSAADEDAIAETDARALHACESDAERLKHGAVFEAHVADLVAPDGRVVDVAAEEAVDGRGREEAHLQAAVVAACEAGFAGMAGEGGLDGDTVADLEVGDGRVDSEDFASGLVAQDVCIFNDHGANAAGVPEVDIGAADAGGADADGDFTFTEVFAFFDAFESGLCFGYPELMFWVGEDADIGLCECARRSCHAEKD